MKELLRQVRVIDPITQCDRQADVLITDGQVNAIADSLTDYPADTIIRDCQGMVLGTGLIDLYSHSGEPGFEERETLLSLMQAAAAGGFSRVAILPDTAPAIDQSASVTWFYDQQKVLDKTPSSSSPALPFPRLYPWAALTQDLQGKQMTELAELAVSGIAGFTDGRPIQNLLLVQRILEYLRPLEMPIALWACDPALVGDGAMREGQESMLFGIPGIPAISETATLAALLEFVKEIGTPVHFMRLSTARSVELIRRAKEQGLPVTASTTWMHLLLNTEAIQHYDANLRLDPPLGNRLDQQALIQGVRDRTIDAIAVDHTPFTYEEKTVAFTEAPAGAIGLELALPLLWQELVETEQLSALTLWSALSLHPARCLNQSPPVIAPDQPSEMILFHPTQAWTVESRSLKSRSANTPWLGKTVLGRVVQVWRK